MKHSVLASVALALLACTHDPVTEIVVVSSTDLSVPDEIDTLRIAATDPTGRRMDAIANLAAGEPLPAVVGLVSETGTSELEIIVVGERDGAEMLRRTARVSFVRGEVLSLRMDLFRRCVGIVCGEGGTCGEHGCRTTTIEASELERWTGLPAPHDASSIDDAGTDASIELDAATTDAAEIDAAELDAAELDAGGCRGAHDCDDGWTCTADSCVAGRCMHATNDGACDDGVACTTERCELGRGCVYETHDADCSDGVSCTSDTCDQLEGCVHTPQHSMCTVGAYCHPLEGCRGAARFSELYTAIITPRCAPCHTTTTPRAGGLDMSTEALARAALVGVTATCGGGANTRVIPGDAAHSLLWRKVAGVDLCGVRMPRMLTPLSTADIDAIAHWIDSGAR